MSDHPQPSLRKFFEEKKLRREERRNYINDEGDESINNWVEKRKKNFPCSKKRNTQNEEVKARQERGEYFYRNTEWYEMYEVNENRYSRKSPSNDDESDSDDMMDDVRLKKRSPYVQKMRSFKRKKKRTPKPQKKEDDSGEVSSDDMLDCDDIFKPTPSKFGDNLNEKMDRNKKRKFHQKRRRKRESILDKLVKDDKEREVSVTFQAFRHIVENNFFQKIEDLDDPIRKKLQKRK